MSKPWQTEAVKAAQQRVAVAPTLSRQEETLDALAETAYRAGVEAAARKCDPATSGFMYHDDWGGESGQIHAAQLAEMIRTLLPPTSTEGNESR